MSRKNSFKREKMEEKIRNDVNEFLRKGISDHRVAMTSISKVELSGDYSHAKLYWDTYDTGKRSEAEKAFEGLAGRVRAYLAQSLSIRQVPSIAFIYDNSYEAEKTITELLSQDKVSLDDDDGAI